MIYQAEYDENLHYKSTYLADLRESTGYSPYEDCPVDALIDYKDSLEELVSSIEPLLVCNSGDPKDEKIRDRMGWVSLSAADVTEGLWGKGLGKLVKATPEEVEAA